MIAIGKAATSVAVATTLAACASTAGVSGRLETTMQASRLDGAYVPTPLGRLFVKEVGSGATAILLWPSIFTDHLIYEGLTNELSEEYRFLLVDGPGHGRSEGLDREFTVAEAADAMVAVLDRYEVEKAVVGGTSWGGLTAAELSLSQPGRVQALILMNTPMEIDERRPAFSARLIAFGARYGLGASLFRNGVASSFFSDDTLRNNPDYERAFHAMLRNADASRLSTAVRSVILRGSPLKDRMSQITAPTLVIAGAKDAMYPIKVQRQAAALAHLGEFAEVDGKHISVVEQPKRVAELIDEFIRGLPNQP